MKPDFEKIADDSWYGIENVIDLKEALEEAFSLGILEGRKAQVKVDVEIARNVGHTPTSKTIANAIESQEIV